MTEPRIDHAAEIDAVANALFAEADKRLTVAADHRCSLSAWGHLIGFASKLRDAAAEIRRLEQQRRDQLEVWTLEKQAIESRLAQVVQERDTLRAALHTIAFEGPPYESVTMREIAQAALAPRAPEPEEARCAVCDQPADAHPVAVNEHEKDPMVRCWSFVAPRAPKEEQ